MYLSERKDTIRKDVMENHLIFMRTESAFVTHEWVHQEFYTCYYAKEEGDFLGMGSIGIFHSVLTGEPSWSFMKENEDVLIRCKTLKSTPSWFQALYERVVQEHLTLLQKAAPESKYSKEKWNKWFQANALEKHREEYSFEPLFESEMQKIKECLGIEYE